MIYYGYNKHVQLDNNMLFNVSFFFFICILQNCKKFKHIFTAKVD